jgi:hypothetical protein
MLTYDSGFIRGEANKCVQKYLHIAIADSKIKHTVPREHPTGPLPSPFAPAGVDCPAHALSGAPIYSYPRLRGITDCSWWVMATCLA